MTAKRIAAFASEHGVAALGHERAGVVTLQCTGAFLDNRWVLTHRRRVEGGVGLILTEATAIMHPAANFAECTPMIGGAAEPATPRSCRTR